MFTNKCQFIGYDCPILENLYDFVSIIAISSINAAKALNSGLVDTCVNFCGGWHHAQRDQASGFCYVNDCVLAILELEKKFNRVLYIDLDIHHGKLHNQNHSQSHSSF